MHQTFGAFDGRDLIEKVLCCTSGFKALCAHHSLFSGGACQIGYAKV